MIPPVPKPGTSTPPPSETVPVPDTNTLPIPRQSGAVETYPWDAGPTRVGRTRWGWVLLLTALGLAAAPFMWRWWAGNHAPLPYKTALVDRGPIVSTVTATGVLNPVVSVQVGSQVSGKVKELYADFNTEVTKGQTIAQIDPAPFLAKAQQARAALKTSKGTWAKAKTALAQRELELNRAIELRAQQFIPQADLDLARTNFRDAQAQVDVARAQVEQAEAALASAELDLSFTTIYSPVDGIVISRNVEVGQTVAATLQAPTFFVIAQDLTKMQVNASVSEADIGGIVDGAMAEFLVDTYPNEPFTGVVTQVRHAPITVQNVVTYDVIIRVDNAEQKLKPGMTANVSIVRAKQDAALRIPNAALRFRMPETPVDPKTSTVWTVDASQQARAKTITPGIADSGYTEVRTGELQEGDRVIVGFASEEEAESKSLPPGFVPRMR